MKVYLVHHGEYSDYEVDAIFEDQDTAEKYCDLHNKYDGSIYSSEYEYEEWDTTECVINMQKDRDRVGYLYFFDRKGHLKEENSPKLKFQWRKDEEVCKDCDGYSVVIFANNRSEAKCRKIACDKVAIYRAMEELF
jgi:hypothetical protein